MQGGQGSGLDQGGASLKKGSGLDQGGASLKKALIANRVGTGRKGEAGGGGLGELRVGTGRSRSSMELGRGGGGGGWFEGDVAIMSRYPYFTTPIHDQVKGDLKTPGWMDPKRMSRTTQMYMPPKEGTLGEGGGDLQRVRSMASTVDSSIAPNQLRAMDNKELRHAIARWV